MLRSSWFFVFVVLISIPFSIAAKPHHKGKVILADEYYYSHTTKPSTIDDSTLVSSLSNFLDLSKSKGPRWDIVTASRISRELTGDRKTRERIWLKNGRGFQPLPFDEVSSALVSIKESRKYNDYLKNPPPKKEKEKSPDELIAPEVLDELTGQMVPNQALMVAAEIVQPNQTSDGIIDLDSLIAEGINSAIRKIDYNNINNSGSFIEDYSGDPGSEEWLSSYWVPSRDQWRKLTINTVKIFCQTVEEKEGRSQKIREDISAESREEVSLLLIRILATARADELNIQGLPENLVDNLQTLVLLSEAGNIDILALYFSKYILKNFRLKNEEIQTEEENVMVAIEPPPTN